MKTLLEADPIFCDVFIRRWNEYKRGVSVKLYLMMLIRCLPAELVS